MITAQNTTLEGYWNVMSELKTVNFPSADWIRVELLDGRIITLP